MSSDLGGAPGLVAHPQPQRRVSEAPSEPTKAKRPTSRTPNGLKPVRCSRLTQVGDASRPLSPGRSPVDSPLRVGLAFAIPLDHRSVKPIGALARALRRLVGGRAKPLRRGYSTNVLDGGARRKRGKCEAFATLQHDVWMGGPAAGGGTAELSLRFNTTFGWGVPPQAGGTAELSLRFNTTFGWGVPPQAVGRAKPFPRQSSLNRSRASVRRRCSRRDASPSPPSRGRRTSG